MNFQSTRGYSIDKFVTFSWKQIHKAIIICRPHSSSLPKKYTTQSNLSIVIKLHNKVRKFIAYK